MPARSPPLSATTTPGRGGEVVYQVYVRSFQDSNGDGIGDLAGITRRLEHIAAVGVDVVWITPFFASPMRDFGYDVADYCAVDPLFGTMADVEALLARAHALGLRVLFDLVLSHTSDRHAWFVESASSRDNPKHDWYVWADPRPDGTPPNNWLAVFGGPAWHWHPGRGQYYLHNFLTSQPDLNFHQPAVQEALLDVARFWLDKGADGFRLDVVNYYAHDPKLRNNPAAPVDRILRVTSRTNPYGWQDHVYDHTRPETLAFVERLRAVVDGKAGAMLVGELVTDLKPERRAREYTAGKKRLHMVYSFDLFGADMTAGDIRRAVERIDAAVGATGWVSYALSNHDVTRAVTRLGFEADAQSAAPLLAALLGTLRGAPCLYQGDELGMVEAEVPFEALQDPYGIAFWPQFKGRDGARTPMVWDNIPGDGFAPPPVRPWLPVDPRHRTRPARLQEADPGSAFGRIARFLRWRRGQPALLTGSMRFHDAPEPVLVVERMLGRRRIVAALNLGPHTVHCTVDAFAGTVPLSGHGFAGALAVTAITLPPFGAVFAGDRVSSA